MFARLITPIIAGLPLLAADAFAHHAYKTAIIRDVPHVRQLPDFCGEACTEMLLRKLGKRGDQKYVFNMSGLDPGLGRGCYSADLARALARIGFKPGDVFNWIQTARADDELEEQWRAVQADLAAGLPTIVCMRADASPNTTEHMRLVVGYDAASDEVLYLEPASDDKDYQRMRRAMFLSLWPLKYERDRWLVIRFRTDVAEIIEPDARDGLTNADYAQHIFALKKRLPPGFSTFIERPFVVVGDAPAKEVERICHDTVRWTVARLKQDYFQRDPDHVITIWLLKTTAATASTRSWCSATNPRRPMVIIRRPIARS
jgi:hypothetical protein